LIRDAAAAAEAAAEFDEAAEEAAASAACWRRVRALVFAAFTLRFELALWIFKCVTFQNHREG
jgi:hypothetical protein